MKIEQNRVESRVTGECMQKPDQPTNILLGTSSSIFVENIIKTIAWQHIVNTKTINNYSPNNCEVTKNLQIYNPLILLEPTNSIS